MFLVIISLGHCGHGSILLFLDSRLHLPNISTFCWRNGFRQLFVCHCFPTGGRDSEVFHLSFFILHALWNIYTLTNWHRQVTEIEEVGGYIGLYFQGNRCLRLELPYETYLSQIQATDMDSGVQNEVGTVKWVTMIIKENTLNFIGVMRRYLVHLFFEDQLVLYFISCIFRQT